MYEAAGDGGGRPKGSQTPRQGGVVERVSRYGIQVMPGAAQRRTGLQRQHEAAQREAPERTSITTAVRRQYLKELLLTNKSHRGFSSVLSSQPSGEAPCAAQPEDTDWALYPMEHAWMLSAVEGNFDTLLEFISEDPHLLTRRDFISGYTVLHWLAKRGQDETLLKVLSFAQGEKVQVNVNVRGSGGLTPLHLASMHGHYMVIKLLVGAFGANVDAMDYNGRRAWQYLKADAPQEMKELLGTWDDDHWSSSKNSNRNNNCTEILETQTGDEVESGVFQRTKSRKSWRFGSIRKMLQTFVPPGNTVE